VTPYRHAGAGPEVPQAPLASVLVAHLRGLVLRLWLRERRRRAALRRLVALGLAITYPGRGRVRANVNALLMLLVVMAVAAGIFCIFVEYCPSALAPNAPRPFVTWSETRAAEGGWDWNGISSKRLSIDPTGHYVATDSGGSGASGRRVSGKLPLLEMARLQQELREVSWGRATYGGCAADCETIVLGEGNRAITVSRDTTYGQSPWASPELRQVFTHLGELYERTNGERAEK
jgi:hypothetical protein